MIQNRHRDAAVRSEPYDFMRGVVEDTPFMEWGTLPQVQNMPPMFVEPVWVSMDWDGSENPGEMAMP